MLANETERMMYSDHSSNETCQSLFNKNKLHNKYEKRRAQYLLLVAIMAIFASLIKWTLRYINKAMVCSITKNIYIYSYQNFEKPFRKTTKKVLEHSRRIGQMNRQGRQLVRCRQIVTIATIIMSTAVSGIQILLGA